MAETAFGQDGFHMQSMQHNVGVGVQKPQYHYNDESAMASTFEFQNDFLDQDFSSYLLDPPFNSKGTNQVGVPHQYPAPAPAPHALSQPRLDRIIAHNAVTFSRLSYRSALQLGNPLLALPQPILNQILARYLSHYRELHYIEMPEARDLNLPPFVELTDSLYKRGYAIIVEEAAWSLVSDAAVISLMVFLNEFGGLGYDLVKSVEFTSLAVLEKSDLGFKSNGAALLERCSNIQHLSLIINLDDVVFSDACGYKGLDTEAMAKKFDLSAIVKLPNLQTVKLSLQPFMALKKKVSIMEDEKLVASNTGLIVPGIESFWGLKEWLELQALDQMRLLHVECPRFEDL